MKKSTKLFFFAAFMILSSFCLSAQISTGVRVGVNLTTSKPDNIKTSSFFQISRLRTSDFVFGIPLEIPLGEGSALLTELGWQRKSVNFSRNQDSFSLFEAIQENHLTLAILGKWRIFKSERQELGVQAGLSFRYLTGGKRNAKLTYDGSEWEWNMKYDLKSGDVPRFSGGIIFGFYATQSIRFGKLFADIRFNPGVKMLTTQSGSTQGPQNRGTQLSVGYLIPLK